MFASRKLLAPLTALVMMTGPAMAETANPFALLVGKWGGNGLMTLEGNRKVRLVCDAQYSGGAAQLSLAINCTGGDNKVQMRARLSANAGRLAGTWEEKTYNVIGAVNGVATDKNITFNVMGAITGRMTVSYTRARQQVAITVQGVPLQAVTMNLTRR